MATGAPPETVTGSTAVFDFDGTLTRRDTLIPFLRHALGPGRLRSVVARWMIGNAARPTGDRHRLKEALLAVAFAGMDRQELTLHGRSFAQWLVDTGGFRDDAMARLEWHRRQGHRLIIVSASVDAYLQPVAAALGVELSCTRLAYDGEGRFTGTLAGSNCRGPIKVDRLHEMGVDRRWLWAYGNSGGDDAMLAFAAHGIRVGRSPIPGSPAWTGNPALGSVAAIP